VGFFIGSFRTAPGQTYGLPCVSERPRPPKRVRVRDNGSRGAGCRAQARAPLRSRVDRPFSARSAGEAPYAPPVPSIQKPTENPEQPKRLFRVFRGILDWVGIRVSRLGVHGMRLRRRLFLGRKWRGPQPLGLFCARRGRVPRGQATAPPARARRRPTSLAPLGSISSSSFPWMVDPEFCGFRSHRLSSPS
jgi:hypothetical protein